MQKEESNKTQKVVPLRRPTEITDSGVGEVLEVRDGQAVSLSIEGSDKHIVAMRQLSHVSGLREGDTVTLLLDDIICQLLLVRDCHVADTSACGDDYAYKTISHPALPLEHVDWYYIPILS